MAKLETLTRVDDRGVIKYYTNNGYVFYTFYQKYTDSSKIIIESLIDKDYIHIATLTELGKISQSYAIQLALEKIQKIEEMY